MAEETSYDGGIGGKFRKRPFRRPASTPYDRPPSAVRPVHRAIDAEGGRKEWISKFKGFFPKIIADSATKFFSSVVYRKRLDAPHATQAPDAGIESRDEVIGLIPDSSNVPNQSPNGSPPKENPNTDSISELEKLLEQKTFTRAEFDRLTELLRSRTVGPSAAPESKHTEPNASRPDTQLDTEQESSLQILEKRINDHGLFGSNTRATIDMNIPEKEIASPAELAKAYMVSRPSKLSTPITGLHSPTFREATPLSSNRPPLPRASDLSVVPRSMVRLPGPSENGYKTPRSQGRSAIYKMSRSPYFKAQSLLTAKDLGSSEQSHARASSLQLVPSDVSDGKQVLKRRSSFIDNDVGSFGPIRRIRQKSNLITPEKEITGRYLSTPANDMHVSMSSIQKSLLVDAPSYNNSGLGEDNLTSKRFAAVPTRSTQMASKIFEQLYLLGSPPKEKASELKAVSKDESPTKLSINMLNGHALMSLKDTGASKSFSFEDNKYYSSSNVKDLSTSVSEKVLSVRNNGPTCSVGIKHSASGAADGPIITASAVSQKRPAFLMQVPEVSSDGDVENQGANDTPNILNTSMELSKQLSKHITSEISPKEITVSSAEIKPNADLVIVKEFGKKREFYQVPGKDIGFSFPVASSKSSLTQPPPTPTMPSPTLNPPDISKEEVLEPVFTFGSGKATSLTFSSVTSDPNATVPSESKADTFASTSTTRTTQLELPKFMKGKETEKSEEPLKPFQSSTSTIPSGVISPSFNFGASASSGLSNGSLKPMPSMFSASASPATPLDGASVTIVSSSSFPAHNINGSSATALTSVPATSSTSTPVGSGTPVLTDTVAPVMKSAAQSPVQSSKDSLFSTKNDLGGTNTATFGSSVTSIFGLSSASVSTPGAASVPLFGSQSTSSANGSSVFGQSTSSAASSSAHGSNLTTPTFGSFGSSSTSASPFSFGLSSGSGNFSTPSTSLTSQMTTSSLFSSSSVSASPMTASNLFSSSSGSSLSSPVTVPSVFASASQPVSSPIFGSGTTSSSFSFGQPTASGASSFSFGSSGATFSFASAPSSTAPAPTPPAPVFGTPAVAFGASSPGNDQMNVEDSMADDTVQSQTAMPIAPAFGQAANTTAPSTFSFGSPQPSASVPFQFGSQPSAAFPQAQSPFQHSGNVDFGGGISGSFSLGSGGGGADRSARKIIRVRKDNKNRKK